jgi:hypothetical protein
MTKITVVLAALLMAGGAHAQEADFEEEPQAPTHSIKVLEHPYDIASFYRSSQSRYDYYPTYPGLGEGYYGGGYGGGYAAPVDPRYPIAGFYRQGVGVGFGGRGYGYSAFWTNGYRSGWGMSVPGFQLGYRHRIGQNGDLFLLAPTFLAPFGPLSGAFFDGR